MTVQLEEPSRPADDDCCGGGCSPCVWDIFFTKRQAWEDQQTTPIEHNKEVDLPQKD